MNNCLVQFNATDVSVVDPKALPVAISKCFSSLKEVEDKVSDACKAAEKSLASAKSASGKTINCIGWGTKDAVYALQEAVEAGAISQTRQQEVLDRILEFQQATAKGMKYLFQIGAAGIAANRAVSKAIRDRMKDIQNGSPSEFDDYVMSELSSTLVELKRQEDLLLKQEKLNDVQKQMREEMRSINDELERRCSMIDANAEKIESQQKELKRQAAVRDRQEAELRRQAEADKALEERDSEHEKELRRQAQADQELAQKDREHELELKRQADKSQAHDAELKRQANKDVEHDNRIDANAHGVEANKEKISVNAKGIADNATRIDQLEKTIESIRASTEYQTRNAMLVKCALTTAAAALLTSIGCLIAILMNWH